MARTICIDDVQADRKLVAVMLRKMGHSVVVCDDREGWKRLFADHEQYDLVVLDMIMPIPGDAFIKEMIRQGVKAKVIGLSGGMEGRFEALLNAEKHLASAILTKPVDRQAFVQAVTTLMSA